MAEGRKDLMETGAKFDGEKLRWDLLPFDALDEVTRVYTLGARKYADRNWEKGILYMRIVGALLRHLTAWVLGEKDDKENGQPHMASVAWNALALLAYEKRGMNGGEWDDRPKAGNGPTIGAQLAKGVLRVPGEAPAGSEGAEYRGLYPPTSHSQPQTIGDGTREDETDSKAWFSSGRAR